MSCPHADRVPVWSAAAQATVARLCMECGQQFETPYTSNPLGDLVAIRKRVRDREWDERRAEELRGDDNEADAAIYVVGVVLAFVVVFLIWVTS